MINFFKNFYKSFYIYSIGILSSNVLILLILPYLTKIFNPTQFALIEIFTILITLILIITNFGIGDAQSFFYYKYSSKINKQKELITSSLFLRIFTSVIFFLFFICLYLLNNKLQNFFNSDIYFFFTIFFIATFTGIFTQGLNLLNLKFYQWKFNLFNILKTLLIFLCLIYFLYINNFGY